MPANRSVNVTKLQFSTIFITSYYFIEKIDQLYQTK